MGNKKSKDMLMMVVALTLVTVIAASLLSVTDIYTREPIREAQRAMLYRGLEQVLPAHANNPIDDKLILHTNEKTIPVYLARDAKKHVTALAWEVIAPDGYSGSIRILVGILPDGHIHAVRITDHQETPGLGDGIVRNKAWIDFFADKTLDNTRWAVKKDGGDFDQFTGATITPRAVVKAVKKALEFFAVNRKKLLEIASHLDMQSKKEKLGHVHINSDHRAAP